MLSINKDACTHCGACRKACPSGAINIKDSIINAQLCIRCFHCIGVCESSAVTLDSLPPIEVVSAFPDKKEMKNLIAQRRTIRHFSSDFPGVELLNSFISDLKYSPSGSNARQLSFSLVTNPGTIKKINDQTINVFRHMLKLFGMRWLKMPLALALGKETYERLCRYYDKFEKGRNGSMIVYNAPAIIVVHSPSKKQSLAATDAAIWLGQASLYAPSMGLGTCINGFIVKAAGKSSALKALLGVPGENMVHAALLIGYPSVRFVNLLPRESPLITLVG